MSSEFEAALKAAEHGDASAQNNLGEMFRDGDGVLEDDAEAVRWFRKAAEQGDAAAQLNLGSMYVTGVGVPKDDDEAYAWCSVAARHGNERAKEHVLKAKSELTTIELFAAEKRAAERAE